MADKCACPHCGDSGHGVSYEWTLREKRSEAWDGTGGDTSSSVCLSIINIKCSACGRGISRKTLDRIRGADSARGEQ
jgi:hypothetical protein